MPIIIDHRSLEEIGLSGDEPVTIAIADCKLRSLLNLILQDLDLTFTVQSESLVITTEEYTDQGQLNRIHWLEGTGDAAGDYQSIFESITTSIAPSSWEAMGGPSKIGPLGSSRPALMIRANDRVHHQRENLFKTLRESHFGMHPVQEQVQIPALDVNGGPGHRGSFFEWGRRCSFVSGTRRNGCSRDRGESECFDVLCRFTIRKIACVTLFVFHNENV